VTDALGSTVVLTDGSGVVKTSYAYEPYGNTTASGEANTNAAQYSGRENDGTGLYYYRARYYHPGVSRFVAENPIGLAGGNNLYAYVEGSPISYDDPFGLSRGTVLTGGPIGIAVIRPSGDIDYYDANGNLSAQYHVSHGEPHGHNIGPGFNRNDHVPMCPIPQ